MNPAEEIDYLARHVPNAAPLAPAVLTATPKLNDAKAYALASAGFVAMGGVSAVVAAITGEVTSPEMNPAIALAFCAFIAALVTGAWAGIRLIQDINYDRASLWRDEARPFCVVLLQVVIGMAAGLSLWLALVSPILTLVALTLCTMAVGNRDMTRSMFKGMAVGCFLPFLLIGML